MAKTAFQKPKELPCYRCLFIPYILFGCCCGIIYICTMEKKLIQFDNQYSVTNEGVVYSLKGLKKQLLGKITKSGYREVIVNHKGKRFYLLVHRLVAEMYVDNVNNLRTVNHKDGNKLNNHHSNLEWVSDSQNLKHARDLGLLNTKITKSVAEQIKNDTGSIRAIAKKYGIGKTQVGYIKQEKRWTE